MKYTWCALLSHLLPLTTHHAQLKLLFRVHGMAMVFAKKNQFNPSFATSLGCTLTHRAGRYLLRFGPHMARSLEVPPSPCMLNLDLVGRIWPLLEVCFSFTSTCSFVFRPTRCWQGEHSRAKRRKAPVPRGEKLLLGSRRRCCRQTT